MGRELGLIRSGTKGTPVRASHPDVAELQPTQNRHDEDLEKLGLEGGRLNFACNRIKWHGTEKKLREESNKNQEIWYLIKNRIQRAKPDIFITAAFLTKSSAQLLYLL